MKKRNEYTIFLGKIFTVSLGTREEAHVGCSLPVPGLIHSNMIYLLNDIGSNTGR
jgi:hypothetical protein